MSDDISLLNVSSTDILSRMADVMMGEDELKRVDLLIEDAVQLINTEFMMQGRDFSKELETKPWLEFRAERVVREMVTAAIVIGGNAGVRTVSSTTGSQSDSITYADGIDYVSFGGVRLTDQQKEELGLLIGARPRSNFPAPFDFPEVYRERNYQDYR